MLRVVNDLAVSKISFSNWIIEDFVVLKDVDCFNDLMLDLTLSNCLLRSSSFELKVAVFWLDMVSICPNFADMEFIWFMSCCKSNSERVSPIAEERESIIYL